MLNAPIEHILSIGSTGIGKDASEAQSPRPKL
jgi:hypothetical protein